MSAPNRIFDDLSKLMTNALGVAQGAKDEAENAIKARIDRWLADRDFVTREEFEAVREMAIKARTESVELRERLDALSGGAAGAGHAAGGVGPDPAASPRHGDWQAPPAASPAGQWQTQTGGAGQWQAQSQGGASPGLDDKQGMTPMEPMKPMKPMDPMKPMEPMDPMDPMEPPAEGSRWQEQKNGPDGYQRSSGHDGQRQDQG